MKILYAKQASPYQKLCWVRDYIEIENQVGMTNQQGSHFFGRRKTFLENIMSFCKWALGQGSSAK
jgi:hypothetical protein